MYANYCDLVKIAKGRRIPIAISFFAVFFCFFNAAWASASGGFRVVSVKHYKELKSATT